MALLHRTDASPRHPKTGDPSVRRVLDPPGSFSLAQSPDIVFLNPPQATATMNFRFPLPRLRRPVWIALLALAAVAAWAILGRTSVPPPAATAPRPALSVSLTTLQSADWPRTLAANGNVVAWEEAIIGAEISNYRLIAVLVNCGRQGQEGTGAGAHRRRQRGDGSGPNQRQRGRGRGESGRSPLQCRPCPPPAEGRLLQSPASPAVRVCRASGGGPARGRPGAAPVRCDPPAPDPGPRP